GEPGRTRNPPVPRASRGASKIPREPGLTSATPPVVGVEKRDSPGQIRTAVARSPFGPRGTDPEPRITGPRPHRGHDWPLDHGAAIAIQRRGRILTFLRQSVEYSPLDDSVQSKRPHPFPHRLGVPAIVAVGGVVHFPSALPIEELLGGVLHAGGRPARGANQVRMRVARDSGFGRVSLEASREPLLVRRLRRERVPEYRVRLRGSPQPPPAATALRQAAVEDV